MNMEMIMGFVRHVLTFVGGWLATSGWISASDVETGVGAIVTIVGIVWSLWAKKETPTPAA